MPTTTNSSDASEASKGLMAAARPGWRQFLVNLRVWAPYFSTRVDRERLVRFSAIDERVGLKWTTILPKQCWSCQAAEKLSPTEFKRPLRAYENPLSVLSGTAAGVMIGLLMLMLAPGLFTFAFLVIVVAIGLAILRLKSWVEEVRVTFWSCPEHKEELREPDIAIEDQQLCVVAPTLELAAAAREAIRERRKNRMRASDHSGDASNDSPRPKRSRNETSGPQEKAPAPVEKPQPVELPPIKLAGEEDEVPA